MNGEYSVASRVVFLNGKPAPKLYRKFNIKSVDGIDDYASMKEVLYRRFLRLEEPGDSWSMPDLVGRPRFVLANVVSHLAVFARWSLMADRDSSMPP